MNRQSGFVNIALLFGLVIIGAVFAVSVGGSKLLTKQYIDRQTADLLRQAEGDIVSDGQTPTLLIPYEPEPTLNLSPDFRQRWQAVMDRQRAISNLRLRNTRSGTANISGQFITATPVPTPTQPPEVTKLIDEFKLKMAEVEEQISLINDKYNSLIAQNPGMETIIEAQRKEELGPFDLKKKSIQEDYLSRIEKIQ